MTNTKPKWEEKFEIKFKDVCYKEELKDFIKKVERDAYERGYHAGSHDFVYDNEYL